MINARALGREKISPKDGLVNGVALVRSSRTVGLLTFHIADPQLLSQ